MNRAQKAVLLIMLGVDFVMILRPPFQVAGRIDVGHYWLFGKLPNYGQIHVSLFGLMAEIAITAIVGFTIFVLARTLPDERANAALRRLSATALAPARSLRAILGYTFAPPPRAGRQAKHKNKHEPHF